MKRTVLVTSLLFTAGISAHAGIAVGSSSLIGTLDYSDTFTLGIGTRATLPANQFPIGPTFALALGVENSYGNPARTWTNSKWSISNDASFIAGSPVYPGNSFSGSATGMTQTGSGVDYGLEFNLRNDFVVQIDAVQVSDRIDITIGSARDSIAGPKGLSVFFRTNGTLNLGNPGEIGIYNPVIGECLAPFDTGLAGVDLGEWHNYAVRFNLDTFQLGIFVDEISLGVIDLATFGGPKWNGGTVAPGAFLSVIDATTNDAVSVGGAHIGGGNRTWTDNFQVGAAVPEPAGMTLLMLGGALLAGRRKRHA
jgi:hypothetical protein